jgi:hypothetical protein
MYFSTSKPKSRITFDAAQVYSNILFWIINTPTFQMTSLLVSSPLSLSVALWGMSGTLLLQQSLDTPADIHLYSPNVIYHCSRCFSFLSHNTQVFAPSRPPRLHPSSWQTQARTAAARRSLRT